MRRWALSPVYPVAMTLGRFLAPHIHSYDPVGSAQRAAYIENVGHEPPAPTSEVMSEQFNWPRAKRRKHNRLTIEQVAQSQNSEKALQEVLS